MRARVRQDGGRRLPRVIFDQEARGEAGAQLAYPATYQVMLREARHHLPPTPATALDAVAAMEGAGPALRQHLAFTVAENGEVGFKFL